MLQATLQSITVSPNLAEWVTPSLGDSYSGFYALLSILWPKKDFFETFGQYCCTMDVKPYLKSDLNLILKSCQIFRQSLGPQTATKTLEKLHSGYLSLFSSVFKAFQQWPVYCSRPGGCWKTLHRLLLCGDMNLSIFLWHCCFSKKICFEYFAEMTANSLSFIDLCET